MPGLRLARGRSTCRPASRPRRCTHSSLCRRCRRPVCPPARNVRSSPSHRASASQPCSVPRTASLGRGPSAPLPPPQPPPPTHSAAGPGGGTGTPGARGAVGRAKPGAGGDVGLGRGAAAPRGKSVGVTLGGVNLSATETEGEPEEKWGRRGARDGLWWTALPYPLGCASGQGLFVWGRSSLYPLQMATHYFRTHAYFVVSSRIIVRFQNRDKRRASGCLFMNQR